MENKLIQMADSIPAILKHISMLTCRVGQQPSQPFPSSALVWQFMHSKLRIRIRLIERKHLMPDRMPHKKRTDYGTITAVVGLHQT